MRMMRVYPPFRSEYQGAIVSNSFALGQPTGLLRLGHGGLDTLVFEERRDQIPQQGVAVLRLASQPSMVFTVSHGSTRPLSAGSRSAAPGWALRQFSAFAGVFAS